MTVLTSSPLSAAALAAPRCAGEARDIIARRCPCCGHEITSLAPVVDLDANVVAFRGALRKLCPQEAEILHVLKESYPNSVAREDLIFALWGYRDHVANPEAILRVLIANLRRRTIGMGFHVAFVKRGASRETRRYRLVLDAAN